MRCIACRSKRGVSLVPMPLTGDLVALCDRCRGRRFLAHMRGLVPHG
jgi:hypothetical protein